MDILFEVAKERSTYFLTTEFLDEDDLAFIPNTLHWKMTDMAGNVVNGHDDEEIVTMTFTTSSSSGLLLTYSGDIVDFIKVRFTTTGTLPTGLNLLTDYWLVRSAAGSARVATSLANAIAGNVISYSDDGSGIHTVLGATGLGSTVTLQLSGDDLRNASESVAARLITFWGTYTSTTYGSGMVFRQQVMLNIEPELG